MVTLSLFQTAISWYLEKGTATHSSILAWSIPWTGQSNGVTKSWTRLSDFQFHFFPDITGICSIHLVNFCISFAHFSSGYFGEGNRTPLQYSCLENPMDGGVWLAAVHGVTKSQTRLSDFTFMHWRRKWQPTQVFLLGESQGRQSLVGCHLWGRTESDTTKVT